MEKKLKYKLVKGSDIKEYIEDIARLRITVFKEFPYLYDGDLEYEEDYLSVYLSSKRSLIILVYDNDLCIGASTCIPMEDEKLAFQEPLMAEGFDISKVFYFGESIILKEYRGQKIGQKFFNLREKHSKEQIKGLEYIVFCSVSREEYHPLRPASYRSLNQFWNRIGYKELDNLAVSFAWKDIDKSEEDFKVMKFWGRSWV